jgi:hypothetical protein
LSSLDNTNNNTNNEDNNEQQAPPKVQDKSPIKRSFDEVISDYTSNTGSPTLPVDENRVKSYREVGPVWSAPLGVNGGVRMPTSLNSMMNRQNLEPSTVFNTQQRQSVMQQIQEKSVMRNASQMTTVQILNGEEVVALKDPYSFLDKLKFENCYRADPTVRRCVDILAKFVMGKRTHFDIVAGEEEREALMLIAHGFRSSGSMGGTPPAPQSSAPQGAGGPPPINNAPVRNFADPVRMADVKGQPSAGMLPNEDSETKRMLDEEVDEMFGDEEEVQSPLNENQLRELYRFILDVNRRASFDAKIKAALTQAYVYGRAALLIETDAQGIPIDLKLLNSKKLETVYVDPNTWKLVAVDYADRPKEQPLLADEIIYLANQDYHISPDTLWYGLSRIETIVHVSETNQLLDEIDLKEGARSMWAGSGVIKFPPDTPDDLVEEFVSGFYPGTWNATSQNVQIDTYNLKLDYVSLTNARNENDRRIIRGLGVPAFLVGFEHISNRATSEEVMISWHESELDAERTWLQEVLEPQWYDPLVEKRFPELIALKNDPNRILSGKASPLRIKLDFVNISFETMKEKAEAIVPLFDRALATPEKVMEVMRWQDQLPAVQAELQKREMQKQQEQQMNFQLQQQRAQSYLISQNQKSVEKRRQQEKDQQSVTANAALASAISTEKSLTTELDMLKIKLLREAHDKEMQLKNAELKTAEENEKTAQERQQIMKDIKETLRSLREQAN